MIGTWFKLSALHEGGEGGVSTAHLKYKLRPINDIRIVAELNPS